MRSAMAALLGAVVGAVAARHFSRLTSIETLKAVKVFSSENISDVPGDALVILTHSGLFHADDVLACMMAAILEGCKVVVVRIRPGHERWEHFKQRALYVIDVGGEYGGKFYDHHQFAGDKRIFKLVNGTNIPLSSFGLFSKDKLHEFIRAVLPDVEDVAKVAELAALPEIDAGDNGLQPARDMLYPIQTSLAERIRMIGWDVNADEKFYAAKFADAMVLAYTDFVDFIAFTAKQAKYAKSIVQEAFQDTKIYRNDNGEPALLLRLSKLCQWQYYAYDMAEQRGVPIGWIVFPQDGMMKVMAVGKDVNNFKQTRCPFAHREVNAMIHGFKFQADTFMVGLASDTFDEALDAIIANAGYEHFGSFAPDQV